MCVAPNLSKYTLDQTTLRLLGVTSFAAGTLQDGWVRSSYRPDDSPPLELRDVIKTYRRGSADVETLRRAPLAAMLSSMVAVTGPSDSGRARVYT
jgi:hypothetical protein